MNTNDNHKKSNASFIIQVLTLVMLIWISFGIWVLMNPINILNNLSVVNIINDVTRLATDEGKPVPTNEVPTVAQINDGKYLSDENELRKLNQINAKVYEKAKNGDHVLLYSTMMVIYRSSNKQIIYIGETPDDLLKKSQQAVLALSIQKAKEAGLIPEESDEVPQVSVVDVPENLKKINEFYSVVEKSDLIISFNNPSIVIIYRPSTDKIVKSGNYSLNIR
jgi:hypothetical protein